MNKNPISIEEVKEKTVPIFRAHPVVKVILFGSYAKNDATDNSDIDLYIDSAGKLRGLDFVGLLEKLVDTLGKDVDLIDKTHIESNSIILQEIEKGGIVLYEKSEAFNKNN